MAHLPIIADTIRCSVEGTMPNNNQWANVLHFRKSTTSTFAAAISTLDPLLFALWNSNIGTGGSLHGSFTTQWKMARIRYTPLDNTTATTVMPHPLVGTEPGEALPANVALVATFYTDKRGKAFRGRQFMGGFGEQQNSNGVVIPATLTAIQNQFTNWLNSLVGTGVSLVVASYRGPCTAGPCGHPGATYDPPTATNVTSIVVNGIWDTQRRRNRP